jgi:hypothetical protein
MRFKFLAVIALASFIGLSGCKGESTNTNANANKANTATLKRLLRLTKPKLKML